MEPWDVVLDLEPQPHRVLTNEALDDALLVAADFIDLKSPYMAGHSRRCARLAEDAALQALGHEKAVLNALRRSARSKASTR